MSNGSILAEEIFYILAPRNTWKLILFFSQKIFSQDESKRHIKGVINRERGLYVKVFACLRFSYRLSDG
jgi:hypothetical protein